MLNGDRSLKLQNDFEYRQALAAAEDLQGSAYDSPEGMKLDLLAALLSVYEDEHNVDETQRHYSVK